MEKIIEFLNKNFDEFELYEEDSEYKDVSFESNKLKELSSKQSNGIGVRAIKNAEMTFASTSNYNLAEFKKIINELKKFSIKTKVKFPELKESKQVKIYSEDTYNLSNEYMIEIIDKSIKKVKKSSPNVLCDATYSLGRSKARLQNSSNMDLKFLESAASFFISCQIINNNDMLNIWDGFSSVKQIDANKIDAIVNDMIKNLKIAQNLKDPPTSNCPVVFTPGGLFQTLISPMLVSTNGTNLSKKLSPLYSREGEKILDDKITLIDNPHMDFSPSSSMYDAEGIPTKSKKIFENGIFINGIYDLKSGSEAGTESTGSAQRSIHSLPSPGISNLIMEKGDIKFSDLVKNISEGIIVDELLGAGQGNELSGDFSANISLGYKIENGEIVGRIKDTMISGNCFKALEKIDHLSKDTKNLYGRIELPFLQTENIEITS